MSARLLSCGTCVHFLRDTCRCLKLYINTFPFQYCEKWEGEDGREYVDMEEEDQEGSDTE